MLRYLYISISIITLPSLLPASRAAVENTLPLAPDPYLTAALATADGSVWIATEGKGIYRCTDGKTWQPMHTKPGYPPTLNAYALAQDGTGAVWVGTDNRGIAVWNGTNWKHIAREHGLAGERIYSIAAHRSQIAVATSGGISLYKNRTWNHHTRADGMADDIASSLSFDAQGNLWAAYACGGIGVLPASGTPVWKNMQAAWTHSPRQTIRQPLTATGTGLPSNLGNAIAAYGPYTYCATTCGIARGNGKTWHYRRGRDYEAKNKGSLPPATPPPGTTAPPREQLLLEDYATALYPCEQGLWAGYREQGVQLLDPDTLAPKPTQPGDFNKAKDPRAKWVRQFVRLPGGALYAATYGGGIRKIADLPALPAPALTKKQHPAHPYLPSIPTEKEIAGMLAKLEKGKPAEDPAFYWHEDWLTRGNWCDRYGLSAAILCAAAAPENVDIRFDNTIPPTWITGMIGPQRKKGDYLRHWLHTGHDHANPNVLWNPEAGTRTEAEWDDHGEEYPMSQDGPDVWARISIPEGTHLLSLYFYNPNGHVRRSGYRDYLIELRTGQPNLAQENIPRLIEQSPVLARTRIFDFAGSGGWKNFIVRGPHTCYLRICRNNSFNTILNGVFLSSMDTPPGTLPFPSAYAMPEKPELPPVHLSAGSRFPDTAMRLWNKTRRPELLAPGHRSMARLYALACYRFMGSRSSPALAASWQRALALWTPESEKTYNDQINAAWAEIQENHPYARSRQWRPYSPGTVPLSLEQLRYAQRQGIDWKQYRPTFKGTPAPTLEQLKQQAARRTQP